MPEKHTTITLDDIFNSDGDHEEPPFHLITTDHPYMATLGLSTFTTGTLYRWWNQKDGAGNYENHKYFDGAEGAVPKLLLLGKEEDEDDDPFTFTDKESEIGKNQFAFQVWRNEPEDAEGRKSGKYETKYIDGPWDFIQDGVNEAGGKRNYTYDDVKLKEADNFFYKEDMKKGDTFEIPDGRGKKVEVKFEGVSPITNVIVLNDYVRDLELIFPLRDKWRDPSDFAGHEFILDIQASKEGYVEWSGLVPFKLNFAESTFQCVKTEWVKYRLHLYPNSAPKSTRRGIAMATPTFVGPPVDSLGRKYQKKEDGRFSAFPEGSNSAQVVAELDMDYNEYTGKWEAGSKQIIGIITQDIPRAQMLTVERLRELKPEEMLASPDDPQSHIIWGSGAAMPLSQQNANPMQWTPNYAEPAETNEEGKFEAICPSIDEEEDKRKVEIRVFNASAKVLSTDQMVLLNQIDGQWFAIDFPSGVEALQDEIALGFEGKWEFSYCATNVVHHFRDKDWEQIDSDDIVQGFHKKYYADNDLNKDTYDAKNIDNRIDGGYHQFTSFDMMDKDIAGTRESHAGTNEQGNAYATTNSVTAPNGDSIETKFDGFHTGAFFGCLFPDGYNSEQIAEYREIIVNGEKVSRNFDAKPTIALSGLEQHVDDTGVGTWKPHWKKLEKFQYFNDDGIISDVLPFNKGQDRNDCVREHIKKVVGNEQTYITMFDDDTDSALTNLPADIATNAAPSGKHGQPIPNLHALEQMYRHKSSITGVREFFTKGKNWLRREWNDDNAAPHYKDGGLKKVHMESSAFDFKPKRNNHIVFRPLKAEVYAQFSQDNNKFTGDGAGGSISSEQGLDRKNFGGEICTQMKSGFKPSSDIAHQREREWDKDRGVGGFEVADVEGKIYPIYNTYWGLQFNIDIPWTPNNKYLISKNAKLPTNDRFRWDAWGMRRNGWCHGGPAPHPLEIDPPWRGGEQEPAGAVGIIGAVATCTAQTGIKFVTNNRLGVNSWGRFDTPGELLQSPAWGKGNKYRDFQTTLLAVKVYHAWPREDTVYDPRYFAVHHFNAGILGFKDDGDPFMNTTKAEIIQKEILGDLKTYDYEIDEPIYNVDYRVPSAKASDPKDGFTNKVLELDVGDMIWKNSADAIEAGWEDNGLDTDVIDYYHVGSLPQSQWKIDTKRRGKLLPYKFEKKTISMMDVVDDIFMNDADVYDDGGYAVIYADPYWEAIPIREFPDEKIDLGVRYGNDPNAIVVAFVIRKPGKGYAVDDMFTMPELVAEGVKVKVTQVDGGEDGPGAVTGLEVINRGSNFEYSAFVAFDKPITKDSSGGAYFVNATSENGGSENGTGFKAFLVSGTVSKVDAKDEKPEPATEIDWHLLSSRSDSNESQIGKFFGLIDGKTENRDIIIDNPNEIDGRYDLFFRFHNDISHTFLSGDHKSTQSTYINVEQYVDLTITTT